MYNAKPANPTRELKVGQEAWYIPGHSVGLLVVKCKIIGIDDWARTQDPLGAIFYEIDEPTSSCVDESELFDTKREAVLELIRRFRMMTEPSLAELVSGRSKYLDSHIIQCTLEDMRRVKMGFIISTWEDAPEEEKDMNKRLSKFPEKKQRQDWFNLANLEIS